MTISSGRGHLRGSMPRSPAPRVTTQPDVAVDDPVAAAGLEDQRLAVFGAVTGISRRIALRRVEQPLDVAFELEDAAVVGADAFEHAVAVEQAVVEDADRGVRRAAATRR